MSTPITNHTKLVIVGAKLRPGLSARTKQLELYQDKYGGPAGIYFRRE
jgi:hypothetical protein